MALGGWTTKRKTITAIVVCAVVVSSVALYYVVENLQSFRGYIEIDGNEEFTKANGVRSGKGTASEPYLIWDLSITKAPGIVIRDTDAHVQIGVVTVQDIVLTDRWYAVNFVNVKNLTLEHAIIENCRGGIYLSGSDCEISYCMIQDTTRETAISVMECVNCTVSHNTVSGVGDEAIGSIQISGSRNCRVTSNTVTYAESGIWAYDCTECEISDNRVSAPYFGLTLDSSEYMVVTGNSFDLNGISVYGSPNEVSSHNISMTNYVGGGPIAYFRDIDGVVISDLSLGQLIVANCSGFAASNLTFNGFQDGIQMIYVDNSSLQGIRIHGAYDLDPPSFYPRGITLTSCADFLVSSCAISYTVPGIILSGNRITLSNNTIVTNDVGIMGGGTDILISDNLIAGSQEMAIRMSSADLLDISNNTLVGDYDGMRIEYSSNVTCSGNSINGSSMGIMLYQVVDSLFYHNNFLENTRHVVMNGALALTNCSWDAGYPGGGNYWSDHYGTDAFSGADQDVPGSDGIGDDAYHVFEALDVWDHYPLMAPVST